MPDKWAAYLEPAEQAPAAPADRWAQFAEPSQPSDRVPVPSPTGTQQQFRYFANQPDGSVRGSNDGVTWTNLPAAGPPPQPDPRQADQLTTAGARIVAGARTMLGMAAQPPVPGMPGGVPPPAHLQMPDVQPVNRWQPAIDTARQAFGGHAIESLGGATLTQIYDNAVNSLSDMVTSTIAPEHLPPGTRTIAPFVNQLLRGIPELGDFLLTPMGAATATGLSSAPIGVKAAAGALFQTQMSQQAKDDIVTAYKHPTAENLGRATKSLTFALLPMLHPAAEAKKAIQEYRARPAVEPLTLTEKPTYAPQARPPAGPPGGAAPVPQREPKPPAGPGPGERPAALTVRGAGPGVGEGPQPARPTAEGAPGAGAPGPPAGRPAAAYAEVVPPAPAEPPSAAPTTPGGELQSRQVPPQGPGEIPAPEKAPTPAGEVVYHGTPHDFTDFRHNELGIHFGTREQAESRLQKVAPGQKGRLIAARIRPDAKFLEMPDLGSYDSLNEVADSTVLRDVLGRPYLQAMRKQWQQRFADQFRKYGNDPNDMMKGIKPEFRAQSDQEMRDWESQKFDEIRQKLSAKGYDGIKYPNAHEGHGYSYSIFDPKKTLDFQSEPSAQQSSAAPTTPGGSPSEPGTAGGFDPAALARLSEVYEGEDSPKFQATSRWFMKALNAPSKTSLAQYRTPRELAADAHSVYHQEPGRPGVVWLNRPAAEALRWALGKNAPDFWGKHLDPEEAADVIAELRRQAQMWAPFPEAARGLDSLADTIREAGLKDGDVVAVVGREMTGGRRLDQTIQSYRHEHLHRVQQGLAERARPEAAIGDHIDGERFAQEPLIARGIEALAKRPAFQASGRTRPEQLWPEIPAYIAAGQWDRLGYSLDEAADAFATYLRYIQERHGTDAIDQVLEKAHYEVRRAVRGIEGTSGAQPLRDVRGTGTAAYSGTAGGEEAPGPSLSRGGETRPPATLGGEIPGEGGGRAELSEQPERSGFERFGDLAERRPQVGAERQLREELASRFRSRLTARASGGPPETKKPPTGESPVGPGSPSAQGGGPNAPPGGSIPSVPPGSPGVNTAPPSTPRESTASSVTFGTGLGGLEPLFREAKAEGDALRAKRNAALAAIKAAEASPAEKEAGEAVRSYFTSERDLWAAKANQALDIGKRKILPQPGKRPRVEDEEALWMMREFRHKPQELAAFIDGSHPYLQEADGGPGVAQERYEKLLPVLWNALRMIDNPTVREQTADKLFTNIATISLREGQKGGWLDSRWQPDEYVPHMINPKGEGELAKLPEPVRRRQGRIGKYFGFGQRRADEYPTMLHAIADGMIPKTLDPFAAFMIHQDAFARARATYLLEAELANRGMGRWSDDGKNIPSDWVRFAPWSPEWEKPFAYEVTQGQPQGSAAAGQAVAQRKIEAMQAGQSYRQISEQVGKELAEQTQLRVGKMGLYVPRFVAKAMDNIVAPEQKSIGFARTREVQRHLKEAILGMSGFHLLTENFMAAADIGPKGMLESFRARRGSRNFLENERDLIRSGGTTSIQGATMGAYRGLQPGTIPTRDEVWRAYVPGSKQVLGLADDITRFTFDNIQRRFKVISFMLHRDAWLRDNPHATPEQIDAAKRGIASYVNGVYGGLHWENLGVPHMAVEVARALLLAPDWSGSNVVLGKYALGARPIPKELRALLPGTSAPLEGAISKQSAQARLARAFWTKQIVGGLIATQLLSLLFTGKPSDKPFHVYEGDDDQGRPVYQNVFFRGSAGDAVSLWNKWVDNGFFEGTGAFLGSKAAPFAKAGMHWITGLDDRGRRIAPKNLNIAAKSVRGVAAMISDVSPIPITLRNFIRQAGPGDYLWNERILSLLGPLAQHVVPEGYRMTKEGLVPKEEPEDDRSWAEQTWDQIVTGKARAVGGREP